MPTCPLTSSSASIFLTPGLRSGIAASCHQSIKGFASSPAQSLHPTCVRRPRPGSLRELERIMLDDVNNAHAAARPDDEELRARISTSMSPAG